MTYTSTYNSPLGKILLACDEKGLTGLWFEAQKYYARHLEEEHCEQPNHPTLQVAKAWLDDYFAGKKMEITLPLHLEGSPFQLAVWQLLCEIPYGAFTTYGELAKKIARRQGLAHMSAQAVGGAVGHNPISIIVPCHRVLGTNGTLTGYAGGLDKKEFLLRMEGVIL